jgi:hypothetical protein
VTFNIPWNGNPGHPHVRVFIHAFEDCAASIGTVRGSGPEFSFAASNQYFGGQVLWEGTAPDVGWEAGYEFHGLHVMGGVKPLLRVLAGGRTAPSAYKLSAWSGSSGGGGTGFAVAESSSIYERAFIVVGTSDNGDSTQGYARVYLNDAYWDPPYSDLDCDGLGNGLEAELGLPWQLVGGMPPDFDGDGLMDKEELFGVAVPDEPDVMLPLWGADPFHMDMFVEADVYQVGTTPLDSTQVQAAQALLASLDGTSLGNPDGLDGINLHADNGQDSCVPPNSMNCSTLWGDWGGSTVVTQTLPPGQGLKVWASKNFFEEKRLGLFRYAIAEPGDGGQADGWRFHWGNNPPPWSDDTRRFIHELGHTLGLEHGGSADNDWQCKANYLSIMNYAYEFDSTVGFSDGSLPGLDPRSLCETTGVPGGASAVEANFGYPADPSDPSDSRVDWNLDGDWSDCGATAVGANVRWSRNAWSVDINKDQVDAAGMQDDTPALAGVGQRLFAFFRRNGDAALVYRTFLSTLSPCGGVSSSTCCPDDGGGSCGTWSDDVLLQAVGVSSSPAAEAFTVSLVDGLSQARIVYAYVDDSGPTPRVALGQVDGTGATIAPQALPVGPDPLALASSVDLAAFNGNLHVLYRSAAGLYEVILGAGLAVIWHGAVVDSAATQWTSNWAPSVIGTSQFGAPARLVALIAPPSAGGDTLTLLERDPSGTWLELTAVWTTGLATVGPPTLVDESPFDGGLTAWYVRIGAGSGGAPRYHAQRTIWNSSAGSFDLERDATNHWDGVYRGGVAAVEWMGSVVAASIVYSYENPAWPQNFDLRFWPFAHGQSHVVYYDVDDGASVADNICQRLSWALGDNSRCEADACDLSGYPMVGEEPSYICP